ncbi:hypothetical protein RSAG8_02528, partial [Rhizoctonia solani AG-8 WAC10335]
MFWTVTIIMWLLNQSANIVKQNTTRPDNNRCITLFPEMCIRMA